MGVHGLIMGHGLLICTNTRLICIASTACLYSQRAWYAHTKNTTQHSTAAHQTAAHQTAAHQHSTAQQPIKQPSARDIAERPRGPSGVAAFMPSHSKTPYITPSMDFYSRNGVVWGRRGRQLEFSLFCSPSNRCPILQLRPPCRDQP